MVIEKQQKAMKSDLQKADKEARLEKLRKQVLPSLSPPPHLPLPLLPSSPLSSPSLICHFFFCLIILGSS
jgi:hypothetical protein